MTTGILLSSCQNLSGQFIFEKQYKFKKLGHFYNQELFLRS